MKGGRFEESGRPIAPAALLVGTYTVQASAQVRPTAAHEKASESRPPSAPKDTVQLSSAAQAALQEALETPAQTAKEAGGGDLQAKRLVAKQAAAKAQPEHTPVHVVA